MWILTYHSKHLLSFWKDAVCERLVSSLIVYKNSSFSLGKFFANIFNFLPLFPTHTHAHVYFIHIVMLKVQHIIYYIIIIRNNYSHHVYWCDIKIVSFILSENFLLFQCVTQVIHSGDGKGKMEVEHRSTKEVRRMLIRILWFIDGTLVGKAPGVVRRACQCP